MYNDIGMSIGVIGYIVYMVALNWMYIREYIKEGNVVKRGD